MSSELMTQDEFAERLDALWADGVTRAVVPDTDPEHANFVRAETMRKDAELRATYDGALAEIERLRAVVERVYQMSNQPDVIRMTRDCLNGDDSRNMRDVQGWADRTMDDDDDR